MTYSDLRAALAEAMRAKDAVRVGVLRALIAACTNELVAQGKKPDEELSEEDITNIIRRGIKQRMDSVEQFQKGGRADLAEKEEAELAILREFMPAMMSREEIKPIVLAKKEELGITEKAKSGILIGAVMKELKGKADGSDVKAVVEEALK